MSAETTGGRRCLVVGSDGHWRGVEGYRWDKLPERINVADYEVAILNFAAFEEDRGLAEGFPLERLPTVESMTRLLFSSGSEIVAIGNPSTLIGKPRDPTKGYLLDNRKRADYWLPFSIGVEGDEGESYSVEDEEWDSYFAAMSRYGWIATGELGRKYVNLGHYLAPVTQVANDLHAHAEPIASTRYGKAVAVRISALAVYNGDPTLASSPAFWLPAPDRVPVDEAIDLILRERHGVAQVARRPDWVASYPLPAEVEIAKEIAELEKERSAVEGEIAEAQEREAEAAESSALLYEKGKDTLEPIVRRALRELGAEVDDPQKEGIEDGVLRVAEKAAVLEIKGRQGPIKQEDVRQVVQWAGDARMRDGVDYRPIIVGNPHCEIDPAQRGDPLSATARRYAENSGVVLLTTAQVFEALRRKQAGEFDEEAFWRSVFAASPEADLTSP